MANLTAGSLFSGIGGIDVAFAAAGFDIRFQVEIDGFCRKVLAKHAPRYWPNATQHVDIRDVGRADLGTVDVLFGGFPCQDISVAGNGAGLEGKRSGLWFEFGRIIGDLRPRFVFIENVPAITSRGGTTVIAHLTALGYDARWGVVSAASAGAPHQRDRWFCVAYANSDGLQKRTDYAASLCQATFPNTARDSHFTSVADAASAERRAGLRLQHRAAQSRRTQQTIGRGDWQQLESRTGAVSRYSDQRRDGADQSRLAGSADGLSGWLHEFRGGINGQQMGSEESGTASIPDTGTLRAMREGRRTIGASPRGLSEAARCDDSMSDLSLETGTRERTTQSEGSESVSDMRSELHSLHTHAQPDVQQGMPERIGQAQRIQAVEDWIINPRWPTGNGQPQHAWEPPRVTDGSPDRPARVKALGNAVVPAVVYPFACEIRNILESEEIA